MLDRSDYFLYTNWFLLFIELNELPGGFVTVGTQLNPLRVRCMGLVDSGPLSVSSLAFCRVSHNWNHSVELFRLAFFIIHMSLYLRQQLITFYF